MHNHKQEYIPKHMKGVSTLVTGAKTADPQWADPSLTLTQTLVLPQASEEAVESSAESVGRNAALMSVLVIVSRLTGFLRTWGQAYALGVTVTASCYSIANNLPNMLYEIVVGGMLVTAFLPVYLSVKKRLGTRGASEYASNLTSIVLLLMGVVTILGFVFASSVVWTQTFDAKSDFDFNLAVYFFRFFVIEVVLYSLSSIFSGILNAERDYLWSSAAPIFNNFVTTASFIVYARLVGTNPQLALIILALGNPLGVAVQVACQMPSLRKHGIHLRLRISWRDPALKETLSIGVPSLVVMLCSFETVSVMNSAALSVTSVGSAVSYYARLWFTLPYAILAVPITTTMFTELSHFVAKGDMVSYRKGVAEGVRKILLFMIPFMLYLMLFSVPLTTILAGGKFGESDVRITALYLAILSVSLPAYGVCTYLQKVCSSLRSMNLYAIASVVAAAVQTIICLVFTSASGLTVVALSSTFYMLTVDVVTLAFLRRKIGRIGIWSMVGAGLRATLVGVLGTVAGGAVVYFLTGDIIPPLGGSVMQAVKLVVAGGIPAVLVTYGLAALLKMPEMSAIMRLVKRR